VTLCGQQAAPLLAASIVSGLKRVCRPEGHRVGIGVYCYGAGVAQLIPLKTTPIAWPPDTFC